MVCTGCGRVLPQGSPCLHCLKTEGSATDVRSSTQPLGAPPVRSTPPSEVPQTESLLPGQIFADRFRIVSRLGKGGMGEVYRAEDIRLRQTIALKFLCQSAKRDFRALERFRDEARLARQVNHSGICRIFDLGEAEGVAYVAMEYIEGENLAKVRKRVGRLPPERALKIALEICYALGAVHDEGILHRDLKPANVMLDGQGRARILDFGLAAMIDAVSGAEVYNGTPAYMAPEQAEGREVTVRSDIYSLGLVLRELWTGERLRMRDRQNPPQLSSKIRGVDPPVDRVLARCLAIDPARRPASAESVAVGLRKGSATKHGPALRLVIAFDPPGKSELSKDLSGLLETYGGQLIWDAKGSLWSFSRPWDAISCAMAYRAKSQELFDQNGANRRKESDDVRLGIEVIEIASLDRRLDEQGFQAKPERDVAPLARALAALALPGQTLLGGLAYQLARKIGRSIDGSENLSWFSHGKYRIFHSDDPIDVFEVGKEGSAPLSAPPLGLENGLVVTGWRPAPGTHPPQRPNFRLERRLGEGGFGEVWLAIHQKTGEKRAFKFCFDISLLRSLRREITLFRLLKEELGNRRDITRVLDWNLDEAPFFIESEYTTGGNLAEWAEEQGGIKSVPLSLRIEIIAQVASALAAAHSVGILHKDVKPGNILISNGPDGQVRAQIADFGVGVATDAERLKAAGITVAGLTTLDSKKSSDHSPGGTLLYLAPEMLEGAPPSPQVDIYALGVVLYQLAIGQLHRALAPGWRDGIDDPFLLEVTAAALHGDPTKRLGSAQELAVQLRSIDALKAQAQRAARRQRQIEKETGRQVSRFLTLSLAEFAIILRSQGLSAESESLFRGACEIADPGTPTQLSKRALASDWRGGIEEPILKQSIAVLNGDPTASTQSVFEFAQKLRRERHIETEQKARRRNFSFVARIAGLLEALKDILDR